MELNVSLLRFAFLYYSLNRSRFMAKYTRCAAVNLPRDFLLGIVYTTRLYYISSIYFFANTADLVKAPYEFFKCMFCQLPFYCHNVHAP